MRACCSAFSEEMVSISAASEDMPVHARARGAVDRWECLLFTKALAAARRFPPDNGPLACIARYKHSSL